MQRNFLRKQSDVGHAALFTYESLRKAGAVSLADGDISLQVRESESRLAVASVESPQQGKQRRILGNRQQLAIAVRPSCGRKIESDTTNFANKLICHELILLVVS